MWRDMAALAALATSFLTAPRIAVADDVHVELAGKRGAALLAFGDSGDFAGVAALRGFGVVGLVGTATPDERGRLTGTYELRHLASDALLADGALGGKFKDGGARIRLRLEGPPAISLKGGTRPDPSAPLPGGRFSGVVKSRQRGKYRVEFQVVPTADRQICQLQGDEDIALDNDQAVGGTLLVTSGGKVHGVLHADADPADAGRLLTGKWSAKKETLKLRAASDLSGGKKARVRLAFVPDAAHPFDGIYLLQIRPPGCGITAVQIAVSAGVVSGVDAGTGEIGGTVSANGDITFSTESLSVGGLCALSGEWDGPVAFTGSLPARAVFPDVFRGTFLGPGPLAGDFDVSMPVGRTGATPGAPVLGKPKIPGGDYEFVISVTKRDEYSTGGVAYYDIPDTREVIRNLSRRHASLYPQHLIDQFLTAFGSGRCTTTVTYTPFDGSVFTMEGSAVCVNDENPQITVTSYVTVRVVMRRL